MAIPDDVKRLFAEYGRQGGKTRAQRLSKAALKESAQQAAAARWKGHTMKAKVRRTTKARRQTRAKKK